MAAECTEPPGKRKAGCRWIAQAETSVVPGFGAPAGVDALIRAAPVQVIQRLLAMLRHTDVVEAVCRQNHSDQARLQPRRQRLSGETKRFRRVRANVLRSRSSTGCTPTKPRPVRSRRSANRAHRRAPARFASTTPPPGRELRTPAPEPAAEFVVGCSSSGLSGPPSVGGHAQGKTMSQRMRPLRSSRTGSCS